MDPIKQVIILRRDLKMRRGKEVAQGSHASMAFLSEKIRKSLAQGVDVNLELTAVERLWLKGSFAKVCLQVESELELLELHQKALSQGLVSCIITDSGKTEFHGVPTHTAIAIGPDFASKIDPITGHLKLY